MGIEMEYQDPFEFWSDPDDADDLLSLSSDVELDCPSRGEVHSQDPDKEVTDAGFSLVTVESPLARYRRPRELGLDWDVNMDSDWDESHTEGSPDAPLLQTLPTQIESLSPPADDGELMLRQGTAKTHFPGLSSMHCQADDLELSFDSDSDQHDLEEFEDVLCGTEPLHNTCNVVPEELEHHASNGSAGFDGVGAEVDGMAQDFCISFLDEDW
ncbi:hypothetical protein C8F04DRAFT_683401 [Mycena alexandri]|uniref:Uncharacterized protein n=1 Tax=Mycena alexandri TaxID=1745969 RepID=A0AAD6TDF3_9AGAR|nr:hypothetical protein C8F04DRAFT_683401 [Mycena alexandri]